MAMVRMHVALAVTVCGLGGVMLSGCSKDETESSPAPTPVPSLEQVWQQQRTALKEGDIPKLLADFSPSVDSSYWVEDENGTASGFGGGYKNVDRAYGGIVRALDDSVKAVAMVDETHPPIIFSIWSGSGVDFASVVSVLDDQSKIIFHNAYILETPVGAEEAVTSAEVADGLEPHRSMEQRWLNQDIDSLMELYRADSKVLYFDEEEVFHVSRGVTEIREFFENTNLTVPFIQPKSIVTQWSDAGDTCKSWLGGFHGDGARRLSMLMHVSHGEDPRNCSSASESSWIQFQVMGYFPGGGEDSPMLP